MWIIAKYKSYEESIFLKSINKKMSDEVKIFNPKIKLNTLKKNRLITKKKSLLNNYLFCFHENFSDLKILNNISNTKGLVHFLDGARLHQKEIESFINYCKSYEDHNGYIKQNFLEISHNKYYKFTSGPFTNLIFKLIEKNKNKIKILIGNMTTVINKNTDCSYQAI
jgi:hypothetical protein